MAALARLLVIGFVVLTAICVALSLYSRAARRRKLARWWEEEGRPGERQSYIAAGPRAYEGSPRRKPIRGVCIVPVVAVVLIVWVANHR